MVHEAVAAHVNSAIEVSEDGATLVVRIGGELDRASRDTVETALNAAIAGARSIVIDLAALTFCDSSGIAAFVAAAASAKAKNVALSIRNPTPLVRRVFDITQLENEITIDP